MSKTIKFVVDSTKGIKLDADDVIVNDPVLDGEPNPNRRKMFVIQSPYGAVCALWADHEEDALDEAADRGLLEVFEITDMPYHQFTNGNDGVPLGNESRPFDLQDCRIYAVELANIPENTKKAIRLIRDQCADNLGEVRLSDVTEHGISLAD